MQGLKAHDEIDAYMRNLLRERLAQCTDPQRELFGRMYRNGIENIPFDKLEWAIQQCNNTIAKNAAQGGEGSEAQAYLDVQKRNVTDIALLRNALATTQAALDAKEKECERLEGVAGRHFDCYQDAITTRERYRKERDTALAEAERLP